MANLNDDPVVAAYIAARRKSPGVAFVVSLIFGPLAGLFLVTAGGVVFFVVSLLFAVITGGWALIILWPASWIIVPVLCSTYNTQLETEAALMGRK